MTEFLFNNIYLAILLPLWIFLIIMSGRFFAVYVNKIIIYLLTILSSFLGALICGLNIINYVKPIEQSLTLIKINGFVISIGLYMDKVSLIMALTLFIISFCVQVFSISYLKEEKKNYKFFAFLNFFNFSMSGLLFSQNLFQFYIFWEFIGVISYLLIGFDYHLESKSIASKRIFIMNRIGDTALLGGILLTSYYMYAYGSTKNLSGLSFCDIDMITATLGVYASPLIYLIICLLFTLGAIVKSAQIPFYTWLQEAMEAKLPVSALLHSATLVAAGIYLCIKIFPILQAEHFIMILLSIFGIATAILCSLLACCENNPKKVLAYSTSANFGLMFWAIGLGQILVAVVFFISHAFIKSMMFLTSGNKTKFDFALFIFGGLSLTGLIFAGLSSKEILFSALNNKFVFCLIAFLTALYVTRLSFLLYKDNKNEQTDFVQTFSEIILAISSLCFYLVIKKYYTYSITYPFYSALIGILFACIVKNHITKDFNTPKILEKIYNNAIPNLYFNFSNKLKLFDEKVLGNYNLIKNFSKQIIKFVDWIETEIMFRCVNMIVKAFKKLSEYDFRLQKRNVQIYNAYAFIIVTIVLSCLIIGYTFIITQLD